MATPETPKQFKSQEVAPIETTLDATAGELEKLEGDKPGKLKYLGDRTDEENRNWKYYSYTFADRGTIGSVIDKREDRLGDWIDGSIFCDKDGNKLQKEWFDRGEIIYIRLPNTDIIDPTPEMTIEEIMSLSDDKIKKLEEKIYYDFYIHGSEIFIHHKDKKGDYVIINGEKLYIYYGKRMDDNIPYPYINVEEYEGPALIGSFNKFKKFGYELKGIMDDTTYISTEDYDVPPGMIKSFAMFRKVGDELKGIFYEFNKGQPIIHRGNLIWHDGNIYPENYLFGY